MSHLGGVSVNAKLTKKLIITELFLPKYVGRPLVCHDVTHRFAIFAAEKGWNMQGPKRPFPPSLSR